MSFQTSNSGAFRSLHCLIYKVLVPLRFALGSVAEHSLSYHRSFGLSSTFFDFFQNLFFVPGSPEPVARKLGYSTTSSRACQVLFSTFSKIFFVLTRRRASRSKAWLVYHSSQLLSSPFFTFLKTFFKASIPAPLAVTARLLYQISPALSIPFLKFFPLFSEYPFLQHYLHYFSHNAGFTMPLFSIYLLYDSDPTPADPFRRLKGGPLIAFHENERRGKRLHYP